MSVVIVSVTVSIVAQQYCTAAIGLWANITRETGTGDIQIQHIKYDTDSSGLTKNNIITATEEISTLLDQDPSVAEYTQRIDLEGVISSKTQTMYFVGTGIKPSSEEIVSPKIFTKDKDQGSFITDDNTSKIAVGKGLADTLGLKIGDEVTLMAQTLEGSMNADDYVVAGIIDMPYADASKRTIYMHVSKAQSLLKMDGGYTSYVLKMQKGLKLGQWKQENLAKFSDLRVKLKTWWEVFPIILKMQMLLQSVIGIIVFLLFLSASISILNIIYILISERTVEIGTLMALGAKRSDVQKLIMLESFFIGALGATIGVVLSIAILFAMNKFGMPFENPLGSGVVFVHPQFSIYVATVVFVLAVLMCVSSAVVPSRGASRLEPVVAFRGQVR